MSGTFTITGSITDADGSTVNFTAIDTPDYQKVIAMSGMGSVGALSTAQVVSLPPPTAPSITNARTVASVNSIWNVSNGGSTRSNNVNIRGTTSSSYPSGTISVYIGGVFQGTVLSDVNGNWTYPLGVQGDATYAITATLTYNGVTSAASSSFSLTINPGLTGLPVGIGANMVDGSTFTWGGMVVATNSTNQSSNPNPNCCIVVDTHTISFTLLAGDNYTEFPSNRTEVAQNSGRLTDSQTFNINYEVMFSGSSPINDSFGPGQWCVVGQLHDSGGSSPPFEFNLGGDATHSGQAGGDALNVDYFNGTSFLNLYKAGSNISRGVWHTVEVILKPNGNASGGIIQVWIDSVQVVNQTNLTFFDTPPYYWKMGMYRGETEDQTQVLQYRNLLYAQS